jgi:hypothetical protein
MCRIGTIFASANGCWTCSLAHSAHAEGPDADEPAVASRRVRHYGATGMRIWRAQSSELRRCETSVAKSRPKCSEKHWSAITGLVLAQGSPPKEGKAYVEEPTGRRHRPSKRGPTVSWNGRRLDPGKIGDGQTPGARSRSPNFRS